jgi:hypothetical protein
MSISAVSGPLVSHGAAPYADYNPEIGPSLFWGGVGILDPRSPYQYEPGQNFGSPTCGWLGTTKINTLNVIPMTKSNTIIAAAAHIVAGTPMTLASANADGIAVGVNGSLYGSTTGANLVNGLCIDPLVASVTANVTSGSNILTVTAVAAGSGHCYNRLAIGMVLTDATTAANIPTGTVILGYGTGNGGIGTYIMSANATATATGDTVTGLFTGINGVAPGSGTLSLGTLNAIPFGQAGTIMMWLPEAMCSRAISITSTTSQVAATVFTIVGADVYGQAMTETITTSGTSATTTNGVKAWKYIQSITPSKTDATGSYSVGTQDIVGLPIRSDNFTPVVGTEWDLSLYFNSAGIASATGYTAAVTTSPATATSGDVRGTYALQTASSGTLRLIATQSPNPAAMGVSATAGVGLFGPSQYTTI